MAYVNQQLPEKEKNQFGNPNQTTPNPLPPQTSGGSAGAGSQGPGGAAPGTASSTQFGSNAAKLSDYLNSNKGQVQEFGNKVAGNLTNEYNQTMGAINAGSENFGQEVGKGYTPYSEQMINEAAQNPTEFAKNPENVSSFKSQYNDEYTGPQNFESSKPYADINNQVGQAVQNANLVGSEAGLKSYLGSNMNTGQNTPGIQTLDTLLLQRSPESRQAIQQAAQPLQGLSNYLGEKTGAANQAVASAKTQADLARQKTQGKFTGEGGVIPSLQNDLNARLQQTRSAQGTAADKAIQDFSSGTATPEEWQMLGLNPQDLSDAALARGSSQYAQDLKNDYGVGTNWNALLSKNSPEVVYGSPGSVATPDEIARAQALSQLTGQDLGQFLGATSPNGPMVNTSKQGLADLRTNLNQRDQDQLLKYASLFGWDTTPPTSGQFSEYLQKNPDSYQTILNRAQMNGDTTTLNALKRMGIVPSTTGGGGSGGGGGVSGGVVTAS